MLTLSFFKLRFLHLQQYVPQTASESVIKYIFKKVIGKTVDIARGVQY